MYAQLLFICLHENFKNLEKFFKNCRRNDCCYIHKKCTQDILSTSNILFYTSNFFIFFMFLLKKICQLYLSSTAVSSKSNIKCLINCITFFMTGAVI